MRFAVDTGGTFTDLIVESSDGRLALFKAATTPDDPIRGVLDSLQVAAEGLGLERRALLAQGTSFIHGTTRAINAIITGLTAKTAFLTTEGHPDILVLREGGRSDVFNFTIPYPEPYVPRSLTFEVPERIGADGKVVRALDEAAVIQLIARLKDLQVEAVAVCLLWSIINPAHEARIGELLEEHLPGVPNSLSHRLNPSLREYRRASSTAIDASLKPLMGRYMRTLSERLAEAGYDGRVLIVTSSAGVVDAADAAAEPIHLINSGPSLAPVAGRHFAEADAAAETAIVADTGGTTYDLSLVRKGRIPWTRETWIGGAYKGHMTGFPSVGVRSIGSGGGSLAWIDDGGLLHVGPQSAGAVPGPVAYGRGGTVPTMTDACLVLGYLDPDFFLGGSLKLDLGAARQAIARAVAKPLGLSLEKAALAVVKISTENMVQAIMDITVNQGIDPADAVLIGGGGAAGLNSTLIAERLGCPTLIIPTVGAALSAAGALLSDLTQQFRATFFTTSAAFDREGVNALLADLKARCEAFIAGPGEGSISQTIEFVAEARYPHQVWEIEVPLRAGEFADEKSVRDLVADFHRAHQDLFAIQDPKSEIEVVGWSARVSCRLREKGESQLEETGSASVTSRQAYFEGAGWCETPVLSFEDLTESWRAGPALVESSFTTVVVGPEARIRRSPSGSLMIAPPGDAPPGQEESRP
ncbi:MAG: hydantoinase/oxoprolinase family protein [Pseudomonadota bacterium]